MTKPSNRGINKAETQKTKSNEYPRSYRLDNEAIDTLKNTLAHVNEISPRKISEARLIKALIHLSAELEDEKLLKALKEVW